MPDEKLFLITGHPRCGTGYMSALLHSRGFDVGHEEVGQDGISSWWLAPPDGVNKYFARRDIPRSALEFDYLVVCTRNPVAAVASIAFTEGESLDYRKKWVPEIEAGQSPVEKAVISYVGWYRILLDQGPDLVVQVERAVDPVARFLKGEGFSPEEPDRYPRKNVNSRPHRDLTVGEIADQAPDRMEDLTRLAERFGYDLSCPP